MDYILFLDWKPKWNVTQANQSRKAQENSVGKWNFSLSSDELIHQGFVYISRILCQVILFINTKISKTKRFLILGRKAQQGYIFWLEQPA